MAIKIYYFVPIVAIAGIYFTLNQDGPLDKYNSEAVVGKKVHLHSWMWPDSATLERIRLDIEEPEFIDPNDSSSSESISGGVVSQKIPHANPLEPRAPSGTRAGSGEAQPDIALDATKPLNRPTNRLGVYELVHRFSVKVSEMAKDPQNKNLQKMVTVKAGENMTDVLVRTYGPNAVHIPRGQVDYYLSILNGDYDITSLQGGEKLVLPKL